MVSRRLHLEDERGDGGSWTPCTSYTSAEANLWYLSSINLLYLRLIHKPLIPLLHHPTISTSALCVSISLRRECLHVLPHLLFPAANSREYIYDIYRGMCVCVCVCKTHRRPFPCSSTTHEKSDVTLHKKLFFLFKNPQNQDTCGSQVKQGKSILEKTWQMIQ